MASQKRFPSYLHPHACFHCRKSFKRSIAPAPSPAPKCPDCGGVVVALDRKFKPPKTDDLEQWAKVRYLVEHGYRFRSIQSERGGREAYPATLKEAREL